jgi:hypothetical protein
MDKDPEARKVSDRSGTQLKILIKKFKIYLSKLVGVEPLDGLVALVRDLLPVLLADLLLHLLVLNGGLHVEAVGLQPVLGADPVLLLLVLRLELLRVVHHAFDLLLGEATLQTRKSQ